MNRLAPFVAAVALAAVPVLAQQPGPRPHAEVAAPAAAELRQIELPVTRAVLFSSGVGYFEHAGTVEGDVQLQLMFKTQQINDVLKSMVLMDLDGGSVRSVSYPSNDPLERALGSFSVDISTNPTLPDLLQQLRGARVTVQAPDAITGSILNVEARTRVTGEPPAQIVEYILHLVTDAGIRSIPLSSVASIQLEDPKLQEELNKALTLLVTSRDTERKPVQIVFQGQGQRRVRVGYVVETPIWKTSYRLDLTPPEGEADANQAFLQGWAIVENTSDSDWQNMLLSLVSGRPISFVQDLYTPLYMPRPEVKPELYASLAPPRYEEGISAPREMAGQKREQRVAGLSMSKADGRAATAPVPMAAEANFGMAADAVQLGGGAGVASMASAANLGELFQYTIQHPVSLPRRRSAMLPIINQQVKAEKVSIYNQQVLTRHPLNGVFLTNDTGLKMLGGPVTVFDGGAYAGDAQIDHLAPNDTRLLSYAVDLAVLVDPSQSATSDMTSVRIVRGVLQVTHVTHYTQSYKIRNNAEADRIVIVEQPRDGQRELVEPAKPMETTPALYRFRVAAPAGKTTEFNVRERLQHMQHIAILNHDLGNLAWYANNGKVSPKVREALARVITLRNELGQLQQQLQQLQQQENQILQDQPRLRENIKTVGAESAQGRRYLTKLNEQEDQLEELRRSSEALRLQIQEKNAALANEISNLNVEP